MGEILPGNWLPALPDGTLLGPRPVPLYLRYQELYVRFANAWRVDAQTSLFDYAPGTSTLTFQFPNWPGESPKTCRPAPRADQRPFPPPLPPLPRVTAAQHCREIAAANLRANCIADVMVTGDASFAKTYLLTEQVRRNQRPAKPTLLFPAADQIDLPTTVTFTWTRTSDRDDDRVTYLQCVWAAGTNFTFDDCTTLPRSIGPVSGPVPCAILIVLLLLFLLLLLLAIRAKRARVLWLLLALLVLIVAILVFLHDRRRPLSNEVKGLKPATVYFWKVVAQDNKGGTTETPMRRFATKP